MRQCSAREAGQRGSVVAGRRGSEAVQRPGGGPLPGAAAGWRPRVESVTCRLQLGPACLVMQYRNQACRAAVLQCCRRRNDR